MKEFARVILIHKAEVTLVRQFGGIGIEILENSS